jgi:hypothetical protein
MRTTINITTHTGLMPAEGQTSPLRWKKNEIGTLLLLPVCPVTMTVISGTRTMIMTIDSDPAGTPDHLISDQQIWTRFTGDMVMRGV